MQPLNLSPEKESKLIWERKGSKGGMRCQGWSIKRTRREEKRLGKKRKSRLGKGSEKQGREAYKKIKIKRF